ncbi:unnamed protein product [Calypogeia fissa]
MLESPKDSFSALWWTESSYDGTPRRNSSFARVNCSLRKVKESDDRSGELDLDGAQKKLTWISREDYRSTSARNLTGNDKLSIQNGPVHGRSARFGSIDSPRRGIGSPADSPARRAESVRRIRTPSMDFDTTEVPSSATPSRRLRSFNSSPRSASFKEGLGGAASAPAKNDHKVVKEAPAIRRGLTSPAVVREQRSAAKPRVPHRTTGERSATNFPSNIDSPEGEIEVVSYLAEETDRIIKERIQKLKLRYHSNAAEQLRTTDHGRSSARAATRTNGRGNKQPPPRHVEKTKAERARQTYIDMDCDNELDNEFSNSPASNRSGSPSLPISALLPQYKTSSSIGEKNAPIPSRAISATMENYLDNRRRGSNMGPQIIVPPRPEVPAMLSSAAASRSHSTILRQLADELEKPSTPRNVDRVGRPGSFGALSRAALSPMNGNEDVTPSTKALRARKEELSIAGEDRNIRQSNRTESTESQKAPRDVPGSVQQDGENEFPSRLQYWADFLGNGAEIDCRDSPLHHLSQQSEERTCASGRKELGKKIPSFRSYGALGRWNSSQPERRPIGGSARHSTAARGLLGHSQRYESEVSDKHNASRRSQSCRRESIVKSVLDPSQENERRPLAVGRNKLSALPSGHDTSSESKNSSRSSVNTRVSNSSDTLSKPSPSLARVDKQKFLFKESSDPKSSSRRSSAAGPESVATPLSSSKAFSGAGQRESGGNQSSLGSRKSSLAGPESGGNPSSKPTRLSVAGHGAAGGKPFSNSRKYLVSASPEYRGSPLSSSAEPLKGSKSSSGTQIDKAKHQHLDTSSKTKFGGSHMDSQRDSQLRVKKKNAPQVEDPKMSQKSTQYSADKKDSYKSLSVQTKKGNQNGQALSASGSVSQPFSMPTPMTVAKPQTPSSPGSSFQRWFANQFKGGSKARSSSTGKEREAQEEPKSTKKSPWRTRPAEILQGITRKIGGSTRTQALPLLDANSPPQNLQQGSSFDSDTSQSPISALDPWHHRMIYPDYVGTPPRKSYALPSVSTMSPARTNGFQSPSNNHRHG